VSRGQPLDPFRHQVGDRQQPPKLQGSDQIPRHSLIRRRRPSLVQPLRPATQERLSPSQPPPTPVAEHSFRPANPPTGRTKRRHQSKSNSIRDLHSATLPSKSARVARRNKIFRRNFVPDLRPNPRERSGGNDHRLNGGWTLNQARLSAWPLLWAKKIWPREALPRRLVERAEAADCFRLRATSRRPPERRCRLHPRSR
jgi:hypothetical protein